MLSHTVYATLLTELGKDVTTREYEYLKTVSAIYEPDESVTKLHIYRSRDNGNCRASTVYDTKGLGRAATCCNALILSIVLFLSPARLSEIYAFSYCVHHIAHRTGPKRCWKVLKIGVKPFLTTYKQLNHIPDTIVSRIWSKLLKIFVID